jgi:hypothetical protein
MSMVLTDLANLNEGAEKLFRFSNSYSSEADMTKHDNSSSFITFNTGQYQRSQTRV